MKTCATARESCTSALRARPARGCSGEVPPAPAAAPPPDAADERIVVDGGEVTSRAPRGRRKRRPLQEQSADVDRQEAEALDSEEVRHPEAEGAENPSGAS